MNENQLQTLCVNSKNDIQVAVKTPKFSHVIQLLLFNILALTEMS